VFGINSDGSIRFVQFAAAPGYTGRLSVAVADVNGDGMPDVITGTADGQGVVRVFSGVDGAELVALRPFGSVGVLVAASDANRDGFADLFVALAGFPLFAVLSGRDQSLLGLGLPGGVFLG
jgi:hypothetical protein